MWTKVFDLNHLKHELVIVLTNCAMDIVFSIWFIIFYMLCIVGLHQRLWNDYIYSEKIL